MKTLKNCVLVRLPALRAQKLDRCQEQRRPGRVFCDVSISQVRIVSEGTSQIVISRLEKRLPLWLDLFHTCQASIRDVSTIPQLHIQQVRFQEFRDLKSSKILLNIRLKWQGWNLHTLLWSFIRLPFAYVYSIVYISLRHLVAVSSPKGLRASCCHCCKRRPGIMTKLLLAVPYGPRAKRDTDWSEFKCTVPCARCDRCATFLTMQYPGHANLPLSEATSANVTAVFPLAQAVDARCCFYRLYPTKRKQDEIRTSTDRCDITSVILNSALNLKSLDSFDSWALWQIPHDLQEGHLSGKSGKSHDDLMTARDSTKGDYGFTKDMIEHSFRLIQTCLNFGNASENRENLNTILEIR